MKQDLQIYKAGEKLYFLLNIVKEQRFLMYRRSTHLAIWPDLYIVIFT
jgi:hypothetical protein